MKDILVSVIMATKDTEKQMLKKSVESILNQTFENFEFIIICDGSIEDLNIIKEYKDNRIKIINHTESIGLTKSLNEALRIARGKYIARMDSDDISLKNRLKIQVDFMEKNHNVGICSTYTKNIGYKNNININIYNKPNGIQAQLFLYNIIAHPAVMIRKKFIDNNNIFYDESFKYSQDYELWTRCSKITDIYIIPKICLLYRMHKNQISTAKIKEQNDLCKKIYLRNLRELNVENENDKVKYLFYLSGKEQGDYSISELLNFVHEILRKNNDKIIYDNKILEKVLLFKIFSIYFKKNKGIIPIKYIFKGKLISTYFKKIIILYINNIKLFIYKIYKEKKLWEE